MAAVVARGELPPLRSSNWRSVLLGVAVLVIAGALEEQFGAVAGAVAEDEVVVDVVGNVVLQAGAFPVCDRLSGSIGRLGENSMLRSAPVAEPAGGHLCASGADPVGTGEADVAGQKVGERRRSGCTGVAPHARQWSSGARSSSRENRGSNPLWADVAGAYGFLRCCRHEVIVGRMDVTREWSGLNEGAVPQSGIDAKGLGDIELVLHIDPDLVAFGAASPKSQSTPLLLA